MIGFKKFFGEFLKLKFFIECARRKSGNDIFGQEFDSPHLHQKRDFSPSLRTRAFILFELLSKLKNFVQKISDKAVVQKRFKIVRRKTTKEISARVCWLGLLYLIRNEELIFA